jgi:hypothetical protein
MYVKKVKRVIKGTSIKGTSIKGIELNSARRPHVGGVEESTAQLL